MVIFAERYTDYLLRMEESLARFGIDAQIGVLEYDGFMPDRILSPHRFFCSRRQKKRTGKELFFQLLNVLEYWEIREEGGNGVIHDMGCKKAVIYFAEPTVRKNVERVEWCMESGWVYRVDFYDRYGLKYASEFRDTAGKTESRVFYSDTNQEVIVEYPQSGTVTVLEQGTVKAFFSSRSRFLDYYLEQAGLGERYVYFAGGELTDGDGGVFGKKTCRFCNIPECYPVNHARGEVLILTASDQIEGIEYLVEELPDIKFHIGANTEVSPKLYALAERENVRVYPQISRQDRERLWDQCGFYLDINHYQEIFDGVDTAHCRNLLILGYDDTLHDRELVAEECRILKGDHKALAEKIGNLAGHEGGVQDLLRRQQEKKQEAWRKIKEVLEG